MGSNVAKWRGRWKGEVAWLEKIGGKGSWFFLNKKNLLRIK